MRSLESHQAAALNIFIATPLPREGLGGGCHTSLINYFIIFCLTCLATYLHLFFPFSLICCHHVTVTLISPHSFSNNSSNVTNGLDSVCTLILFFSMEKEGSKCFQIIYLINIPVPCSLWWYWGQFLSDLSFGIHLSNLSLKLQQENFPDNSEDFRPTAGKEFLHGLYNILWIPSFSSIEPFA